MIEVYVDCTVDGRIRIKTDPEAAIEGACTTDEPGVIGAVREGSCLVLLVERYVLTEGVFADFLVTILREVNFTRIIYLVDETKVVNYPTFAKSLQG